MDRSTSLLGKLGDDLSFTQLFKYPILHFCPSRTLTSRNLGNLVCLEGIVTKCSLVRPKVVKSVHYCPATSKTMERTYTDMTSFDAFPSTAAYPTQDEEGNKLETEYGLSKYKDHQTITVQEMPEKAPAGQLPRSVDIIADNDLVDLAKPGDRVQVIGSYRAMPGKQNGYTNGTFKCVHHDSDVSGVDEHHGLRVQEDHSCHQNYRGEERAHVTDIIAVNTPIIIFF